MRLILANQSTAAKRRCFFDLRDATDGITAETGEAGGQPQISTNGGAWTNTDIGTLTHIGNGRYYADLTQAAVATAGDIIETRFKSANTAETPGDSFQVVAFDPDDAAALGLSRLDAAVSSRMATFTLPTNFSSLVINASGHVVLQDSSLVTAKLGTFVLAKTTNITGFNDIAATAIVSAGAITTNAGSITLTAAERTSVADALLDRVDAIETAITPRLAFRYIAAACAGKLSGAGTGTEVFDGIGVNTDRITASVNAAGDRTAVTLG